VKLGFYYHTPAVALDAGPGFATSGPQGRFIESLAEVCEAVRCFLHVPDRGESADYPVRSDNVQAVYLPPRGSFPRRLFLGADFCRMIRRRSRGLDAFLIRGPTPLLPLLVRAVQPLPVALLLVGDYLAGAGILEQPAWRRLPVKAVLSVYDAAQTMAARRTLTFVNSPSLLAKCRGAVPSLMEIRTTTLSTRDFCHREDTCQRRPVRLLYTGRYAAEKGLLDLVEATRLLLAEGFDVHLEMAGWEEPGSDVMHRVRGALGAAGVTERFTDRGLCRLGPELSVVYRGADVFVLASHTEGFPRAIWDAMAHGLPVVATAVGGVPGVLRNGVHAVLVEPRDPKALADGIRKVVENGELRRRIIAEGLKLARMNTLERRAGELVTSIERFARTHRRNRLRMAPHASHDARAITSARAPGPVGTRVLCIGNYLAGEAATPQAMQFLAPRLGAIGHEVTMTSRFLWKPLRLADMLRSVLCRRERYDLALIDTFSGQAFLWAGLCGAAARCAGRPYVALLHGGNLPLWARRHKRPFRAFLAGAGAAVAPSGYLAGELSAFRADIRIIPNVVPVERYEPRPARPWRPSYLWLRRFHRIYNPQMAVRAFARIAARRPEATLMMAGPDAGRMEATRSLARELGVADRVRFPGKMPKERIHRLSRDCDFFLHTSRVDNQPVTVLEAMALGLPVVATDVGGMRDLIRDGVTGILVADDDDAAMARACQSLLADPARADSLSQAARAAVQMASWENVRPKWEALLAEAAAFGEVRR